MKSMMMFLLVFSTSYFANAKCEATAAVDQIFNHSKSNATFKVCGILSGSPCFTNTVGAGQTLTLPAGGYAVTQVLVAYAFNPKDTKGLTLSNSWNGSVAQAACHTGTGSSSTGPSLSGKGLVYAQPTPGSSSPTGGDAGFYPVSIVVDVNHELSVTSSF